MNEQNAETIMTINEMEYNPPHQQLNLTETELKLIFSVVRAHQMNNTVLQSSQYTTCDSILTKLFAHVYNTPVQQGNNSYDRMEDD
jgi:hypothetical protein